MKRVLAITAVVTLTSIGLGPTAQAGEITGNGKPTQMRDHAASICAFSGLDDPDDDGFGRTQNWGQLPKADKDVGQLQGFSPRYSCKPGSGGH